MARKKISTMVTCRYCHHTWQERDYFRELACERCGRIYMYDWKSGSPVGGYAVRKMTEKEQRAYGENGTIPNGVPDPVYETELGRLYRDDLFDIYIRHFAELDQSCDVPSDQELDCFVQTGNMTPAVLAYLNKILLGKQGIIIEREEYEALLDEEMAYAAGEIEL